MQLTLRTLLAWLHDTLSPADAAEMGGLVERNQAALNLVGQIYEAYYGDHEPGPVDPSDVAAYIEDELPQAEVLAFEAACINSDAGLAEVAECHRILSALGRKARPTLSAKARAKAFGPGPYVDPATLLAEGEEDGNGSSVIDAPRPEPIASEHAGANRDDPPVVASPAAEPREPGGPVAPDRHQGLGSATRASTWASRDSNAK